MSAALTECMQFCAVFSNRTFLISRFMKEIILIALNHYHINAIEDKISHI